VSASTSLTSVVRGKIIRYRSSYVSLRLELESSSGAADMSMPSVSIALPKFHSALALEGTSVVYESMAHADLVGECLAQNDFWKERT
jgi:hypothetical protein